MGDSYQKKSCKPESSTSHVPEQGSIHVYPDWATMQAYYGPRVSVPPYFNSAIAPDHPPHPYMWGPPQHMIPTFGTPYAAMYAHGGVYAHTGVPLGLHAQGHGVPSNPTVSEAAAATSASTGTHGKSSGNEEQGSLSKMKEFETPARNGNADKSVVRADQESSECSTETEGSSDGSNAAVAGGNNKRRKQETTPANGKVSGTGFSPIVKTEPDLQNPPVDGLATVSQHGPPMPNETWLQDERELKRERRKQSNRESARRSRMRKQAETEELARRVQLLSAENTTLKSEINRLTENSEKLKLENAALVEKLQSNDQGQPEEITSVKMDDKMLQQPVNQVDLLAGINSSNEEGYVKNSSRENFHQFIDTTPRTDAMAAR